MVAKRSGARATAPAAKKVKVDPVTAKVQQIVTFIKDDEECELPVGYNENCRQGLLNALPHALGLGAAMGERHSFQTTVANAVGEILSATETKWQKRAAATKASHEGSKAEKASRDAVLEDAKERLSAGHSAAEAARLQVKADVAAEQVAEKSLKESTAEVDNFDGIQLAKASERDEYASLLKDVFAVLKAGEWESEEDQKKFEKAHLTKLTNMLRKLKIDDSLLSAMGPALKGKPEARGAFGEMTLSEVESAMKKHLENLEGELNNGEATKALKEAAQSDTQVALEAAKEKLVASQETLKSAEDKIFELVEEVKQGQKSCEDQVEAISDLDAKVYVDDFGLENSQDILKVFDFLRDRVESAPEKEIVEEPSEEAMEPCVAGA